MDSSLSSASAATISDDYSGSSEQQQQQQQQQRDSKRFRSSPPHTTDASNSSSNPTSDASESGDDNTTIVSSSSTFVPPSGLEERFQKLLTLQEEGGDEDDDLNVVTQTEVDSLLYNKDMYEMTPQEREQVLWDIHGVTSSSPELLPKETPDFVQQKRHQLQQCLLQSNTHGTHAYSQALLQNARYVQSAEFQLPFLRCEQWQPAAACDKILQFLQLKLQLFGVDKLCRPHITISDLSKEDRKVLDSGFFQLLLTQRDVAGRAIMIAMPMCGFPGMAMDSVMRAFYYMYMVAAQDIETQQKGLILMGCNVGPQRQVNRKIAWHVHKVRQALPLKTMGIHYCYDDLRMLPMMTIGMLVSSASSRVRFRAHYGTVPEIHHTLTTFGIPDQCLPVTNEGEPKIKSFRAWIKSRKQQEDDPNVDISKMVVVPGRVDVLLGRGKPIQEHFGNLRYHMLLDHYQKAYETAKKFEKLQVSQTIVDWVHRYQGRFLKQEGASGWTEVEPMVARDKVSHAFRTRRTSHSSSQQQQQQQQQQKQKQDSRWVSSESSSSLESSANSSSTASAIKRPNPLLSTTDLN